MNDLIKYFIDHVYGNYRLQSVWGMFLVVNFLISHLPFNIDFVAVLFDEDS
jgi:hypothetical protein